METSYRFVIADDHPLFRGALREALSGLFADASVSEAGSFDDASALLEQVGEVDHVLLDLSMPGVRGFSGSTRNARRERSASPPAFPAAASCSSARR